MLRILGMVTGLLVCVPLHYGWRLLGRPSPWPRLFLGWIGRCAGARPEVLGRPLTSHVLFVSNHLSWLDIMVVAQATGAAFVSKGEVGRWPVIGWLAKLNNTVFVERSARGAVHGQADALRTALVSGQPVALFPEGTTDGGPAVLPFRASLFSAVIPPPPGVQVQPVAIDYGVAAADVAWVGGESAAENARRILSRPGSFKVQLHFLDPIDPGSQQHRKTLAALTRERIVAALPASDASADPL